MGKTKSSERKFSEELACWISETVWKKSL
jgi:hypothetical protein